MGPRNTISLPATFSENAEAAPWLNTPTVDWMTNAPLEFVVAEYLAESLTVTVTPESVTPPVLLTTPAADQLWALEDIAALNATTVQVKNHLFQTVSDGAPMTVLQSGGIQQPVRGNGPVSASSSSISVDPWKSQREITSVCMRIRASTRWWLAIPSRSFCYSTNGDSWSANARWTKTDEAHHRVPSEPRRGFAKTKTARR
jgi:hypothetical protein